MQISEISKKTRKQPPEVFCKIKVFLKIWSILQENRPSGLQTYYKETLTQVFSSEIHEIFKITCFEEHLGTTVNKVLCFYQFQSNISFLFSLER